MKRFWHKIRGAWTKSPTVGAQGMKDVDYREVHAQEQARTQLNSELRARSGLPHV
jgi:hypothetical protein